MADEYTFTAPTGINTNALATCGDPDTVGTANTITQDMMSTTTLPTPVTVTDVLDSGGYLAFAMDNGDTLTAGEIIGVNVNTGDATTSIDGFHHVSSFTDPTGVTSTPWETCFTGISDLSIEIYKDLSFTKGNPDTYQGHGGLCDLTLPTESVHTIPPIATTIYTNDYCYFFSPTKCDVSSNNTDNLGTDTEVTSPKTHVQNGVKVFTYNIL